MPRDTKIATRRAHITRDTAQHALDTLAAQLDDSEIDVRQRVDIACRIVDCYYTYLKSLDGKRKNTSVRIPAKLLEIKAEYSVDLQAAPELTENVATRCIKSDTTRPPEGCIDSDTHGGGGLI